jgi:hypothetical protein
MTTATAQGRLRRAWRIAAPCLAMLIVLKIVMGESIPSILTPCLLLGLFSGLTLPESLWRTFRSASTEGPLLRF